MKFSLQFQICLVRFFCGVKPSNQHLYTVCANTRAPSFAASQLRHTQQSAGLISCVRLFLILNVACGRYVSQIFERVIAWIAINMIYVARRPHASHVKPSQTIGAVPSFIDANDAVAFGLNIPSNCSRNNFTTRFNAPSKESCFRVVVQQCTQLIKCDVIRRHANSIA
jgi:hypothetical protein